MFFQWQGNTPVTLRCIDKYFETDDTVSICLAELSESQLFQFKAGQFITLGVEIEGKWVFRAYSLSSLSGEDYLQLTIKRVEGGLVSNYIFESLLLGDTVQALPPAGEFNCIDSPPKWSHGQQKALLISAGCGVTPVFAMAKYWLCNDAKVDIAFLHVARSADETIYFDDLHTYQSVYDDFHLHLLLKNAQGTSHPQGRLDAQWLQKLVPDLHQRTVYLCGPNQFMQDAQAYLQQLGFDMQQFHHESFTPAENPSPVQSEQGVQVSVPNFAQTIDAKRGQVLADVLEGAGLPLIVACRSGLCGSCKCQVRHGSVISSSQETLSAQEIEQGFVLACSSQIESDLEVTLG
ncbi:hybrid-cluster NAD(P)-dependent oxidoreductase [Vibrio navarrensis]|nr:hybrid-cluster NAD(P)-dependent oxidoreductase [Vibrio navarrensis]EJL6565362.1 hybrid-cluster NAD(P)-dependent oxidoreductase [Vibrio navarrensis]